MSEGRVGSPNSDGSTPLSDYSRPRRPLGLESAGDALLQTRHAHVTTLTDQVDDRPMLLSTL